jgi:D-alanyl-lipoteichoic acid acyltransferase DltB (MBOAT superfamily)
MSFSNILIALFFSLALGLLFQRRGRVYALAIISATALYWLQPSLNIQGYEFWLPTLALVLILLSWGWVSGPEERGKRGNLLMALLLILVVAGLEFVSRIQIETEWFNPSPLPGYPTVVLAVAALFTWGFFYLPKVKPAGLWTMVIVLLAIFIFIKVPYFSQRLASFLTEISLRLPGPKVAPRQFFDLRWFGFSYIAFRLIHTLRDRQMRRLPQVSLAEYVTYVVFFPALAAGPIDRIERFVKELRQPLALDSAGWLEAGQRLMVGLFKKFVLADSLVTFALSGTNADDLRTTGWMWFYLYAYTLLIYFDFSGYTDIAIGLGRLLGLKMPENFNAPYLKSNLTQFWNNWHMTLTQWFRAYFFNPLTRSLRSSGKVSVPAVIFITQIATMLLIGLWHGITWNFVLWGLWHGLGLFLQNRWSDFIRPRAAGRLTTPGRQKTVEWLGVFATFNFVTLGWVFFGFSSVQQSWIVLQMLFGL